MLIIGTNDDLASFALASLAVMKNLLLIGVNGFWCSYAVDAIVDAVKKSVVGKDVVVTHCDAGRDFEIVLKIKE